MVDTWVRGGGRLLLIADHLPFAGAAAALAACFGIEMFNGYAVTPSGGSTLMFPLAEVPGGASREPGSGWPREQAAATPAPRGDVAGHPIVRGRNRAESVAAVITFTGQAFRVLPAAKVQPLLVLPIGTELVLPQRAGDIAVDTPRRPAGGLLQGGVLTHGAGRVAIFGEAAMFTAQLVGPDRQPVGMNHAQATGNFQFLLNVMHWLTGLPDNN